MTAANPKGSRGRPQTSSVFIAPSSRPSGATLHRCWVEQLGGAPAGAQSYWQGRFAACAFVERFLGIGRPRNGWGVAKPQPGRCPCTLQGALPLDPFFVPRLERASAALWDSSVKPGSSRPSPIPQSPHPRYTDSTAAPSAGQYPAAYSEYPPPAHSHWQSPAA